MRGACHILVPSLRDEPWTGLGLDWVRTITNFVVFGLDPGYKSL